METKPTGFQCGDDHLMPTVTTLTGNTMNIDVVDVHGADGCSNGHERSCTPLSSKVTASTSDTHRMLQWVRANMVSPRPAHRHGLNNCPHMIVGFDASSNLESQCKVVSKAVIRELIEPISNIAPAPQRWISEICTIRDVCKRHSSDTSILENAEELPSICVWWTCLTTISLPGTNNETNHTILLLYKEKSSKGTGSCRKKVQHADAGHCAAWDPNTARWDPQTPGDATTQQDFESYYKVDEVPRRGRG